MTEYWSSWYNKLTTKVSKKMKFSKIQRIVKHLCLVINILTQQFQLLRSGKQAIKSSSHNVIYTIVAEIHFESEALFTFCTWLNSNLHSCFERVRHVNYILLQHFSERPFNETVRSSKVAVHWTHVGGQQAPVWRRWWTNLTNNQRILVAVTKVANVSNWWSV